MTLCIYTYERTYMHVSIYVYTPVGLIGCGTRQSVFRKNGLNAGNPLADFLLHTFCWPCALTQEMRAMDYISGARRRLYYGVDPNASR